jgi:CRISPR system Cascade subunit CasB
MQLKEKVVALSDELLRLDAGDLAELRRFEPGDAGPLAYWRLAVKCGFLDDPPERWGPLVRILAILTPKGEKRARGRLHDPKRSLGAVLCDGGNPTWAGGGEARPMLSEARLMRLLATPAAQRADAVRRIARMLAASREPGTGLNAVELAALLLSNDAEAEMRRIAREFYRRLDTTPKSTTEAHAK